MRYHLDTSFLIDWRTSNPSIVALRDEITAGAHTISIDPIVQTESFAAPRIDRMYAAIYRAVLTVGALLPITPDASMLAASWLGPMDRIQHRAHFADALIAATAATAGAVLVTSDRRIARVFPVAVFEY